MSCSRRRYVTANLRIASRSSTSPVPLTGSPSDAATVSPFRKSRAMSAMYSPLYAASGQPASPGFRPRARAPASRSRGCRSARPRRCRTRGAPRSLARDHVREHVAERGLAAVADVQRPVGFADTNSSSTCLPFAIRRAERAALVEHGGDHRLLRGGRQAQVDEAGAGDLGGFDEALRARPGGEGGDDLLGELARVRAERLRKLHRDVARDVAVRGDLRALQRDDGATDAASAPFSACATCLTLSASRASRVCLCWQHAGRRLRWWRPETPARRRAFKRAFQGSQNFNRC